jgi:hypothetical protein
MGMKDREDDSPEDIPDLTHIIRSIQRIEGNPDCFGTADSMCEHRECPWREYCLKKT